ncbi:nucleoside-diphosphate sugar epimerase/dehydratase [Paenibacillus thalictri]|uniref:Polysaccharide biosynthesis protein n=1 Tax=Paenibacillus thalictri TaxID=2527873 RepID=A0A4Q9DJ27_9BACL|nr:nucleoside-diphosphate sugar epimerase/dehydratase [Paenibacillus thalictri]TBL70848.1 polysaccharide biosynthesis protein [Paenibacillus thalictri]
MKLSQKLSIFLIADTAIIWASIMLCYYLRFDGTIPKEYVKQMMVNGCMATVVCLVSMYLFRLYHRIWRYASVGELLSILKGVALGHIISYALTYLWTGKVIPLSITVLSFESMLLLMGGVRFARRVVNRGGQPKTTVAKKKALIIGAGSCGVMVAGKLQANPDARMYPVAFVDDDPRKLHQDICGIPVMGDRSRIADIVKIQQIEEIIIAMPSAPKKAISGFIDICKLTKANLKIIPRIDDLIHGRLSTNEIRNVEVEDLLGREPVKVDLAGIADYVQNKVVLITGAGGSIGSELCRQIAPYNPRKLVVLGHGENSIYAIEQELRRLFPELQIEPVIADVQDMGRMKIIFERLSPQVVFHAAAHKHVPLMEKNPSEAIKNNVFGTKNVALCADLYRAEKFVLVSTDKAVNPTSVMGATKRIAEMFIQSMNANSSTKFVAVRFGNVLGSRGSVIPQFKQQIATGGPVTVTHPEMIRYFMTIPEAVQLVIQAGAFAGGGEVFILDMGKPVKIIDLAEDLIRLSGFEPNVDIDIVMTGIRPGEKLYEELLTSEEGLGSTRHDRIFIGKPANISKAALEKEIGMLEKVIGEEQGAIREMIKHIVPTYQNVS